MAQTINGARVDWAGYEFGIAYPDGSVVVYPDYATAKTVTEATGYALKMRALYETGWMDAK